MSDPASGRPKVLRLSGMNTRIALVLAIAAVAGGIVLAATALIPEVELVRTESLQGSLLATSRLNLSFPVDVGLTELRLEIGNCTVFVTALDGAQWDRYNASGELPSPQLTCTRRNATFDYQLRALVVENQGLRPESYEVSARLFAVRSTRALLAIPAFPLILGGSSFLVFWSLQRGIDRLHASVQKEENKR